MKNTHLLNLLKTFSKKEWREMDRFVRSEYYNRNGDVVRLWALLREYLLELNVTPEKRLLYRRLFPGKPYEDQQLRLLMSYLVKLAESFLVQQEESRDKVRFHTTLAAIYRKRQLPRHFVKSDQQAREVLDAYPYRNADYFQDAYHLDTERYRFQASVNRIQEFNLQGIADSLDAVFISQKLRQACSMLSHQAVYKTDYHFGLLHAVIEYVEASDLLNLPAISVYYHAFQALTNPEEPRFFQQFKSGIFAWASLFPPDETRDLFILGINYCIKRYNEGAATYLDDEFEIYQKGLSEGYLLTEGQLSRFTYRNAVALGLVLREYDWVERFLKDYTRALPPEHRESMSSFCMALLAYSKKDYAQALDLLQKSEYEDLLLNLAAKTVQIKLFYEWGEMDLLHDHLKAMRMFVLRKKVMGYHRENYLNAIQMTFRLLETNPFDRHALHELREAIEQTKPLAEKTWLLEQAERLIKGQR